jgi:hypothetical protein
MRKISKKTAKKSTTTATKKATKGSTTSASKKVPKNGMNADLHEKCEALRGLVTTTDLASLKARREIGKHVLEVEQGADKYGEGAVEKLARALGRDADTLYDCAHVFVLLENKKLGALAERHPVRGTALSFSHWVALVEADAKDREELAREARANGWSVRTLKAKVHPERKDAGQDAAARVSDALTTSKKRLDRDLKVVVSELKAGNVSEERRKVARQLIDRLGEVRDAANQGIADLKGALDPTPSDLEEKAPLSADAPDSVPQSPTPPSRPALEAMHRLVAR